MTTEKKPLQVIFAPGCFDNFDGTQEELDELVAEINKMVETGEIFEKSNPVDVDELTDEELEELALQLGIDLDLELDENFDVTENVVNHTPKRNLQ